MSKETLYTLLPGDTLVVTTSSDTQVTVEYKGDKKCEIVVTQKERDKCPAEEQSTDTPIEQKIKPNDDSKN